MLQALRRSRDSRRREVQNAPVARRTTGSSTHPGRSAQLERRDRCPCRRRRWRDAGSDRCHWVAHPRERPRPDRPGDPQASARQRRARAGAAFTGLASRPGSVRRSDHASGSSDHRSRIKLGSVSPFRQNATRAGIARPAPVTLRGSCCAGATRSIAGGTSSSSRRRTGPSSGRRSEPLPPSSSAY